MRFNNSDDRAPVTPAESPASERTGFLHPLARRLARGALVAVSRLGDGVLARGTKALALAEGIAVVADALVDGLDRLDGCAQPPAPAPATVDLGLALRVAELERAVEALDPLAVVERRRAAHPCPVCGGRVVLVLEGAPQSPAGWITGLCAGCRTLHSAKPGSEVLP
jgi:hypothetical protein